MSKKLISIVFSLTIFLIAAGGIVFGLRIADQKRITWASHYESMAENTTVSNDKLVLLVKSDALAPDPNKKVKIALLLLNNNEPQKAERYLLFAPTEAGNVLLAEYYLLNKPENASKYINRLKNNTYLYELTAYQNISLGKNAGLAPTQTSETDIGKLIKAINTQDYTSISALPILSPVVSAINQKNNSNNQSLSLAKYYINHNEPYLGLYVLEGLKSKVGDISTISVLKAAALNNLNNKEAITSIDNAIKAEPENIALYQLGIKYANHFGVTTKVNFWAERLKNLQNIQK